MRGSRQAKPLSLEEGIARLEGELEVLRSIWLLGGVSYLETRFKQPSSCPSHLPALGY